MVRESNELLARIGTRCRTRRTELGMTIKDLANVSGLSPRFLSHVEAGTGNISILRLAGLAGALELSVESLVRSPASDPRQAVDALLVGCSEAELKRYLRLLETASGSRSAVTLALLGIRGSGKSTVGQLVSQRLDVPFVELDAAVESRAGMPLAEIFSLHDAAFYRRLELECLVEHLGRRQESVVAMSGGIVDDARALELIRATCRSVWLRAEPEDYWDRVVAQGDRRLTAERDGAMPDLMNLVRRREPLYRQADVVIETSGLSVETVTERVLEALEGVFGAG